VPWATLEPGFLLTGKRTTQPIFDKDGQKNYKETLARLMDEVEEAEDEIEKADSQRRLDELKSEIRRTTGIRGKPRDLNSIVNRMRPMIWDRLNTIIRRLRSSTPPLNRVAEHFEKCISSNANGFIYDPPPATPSWLVE
jgi:hypothetical protein